MLDGNSEGTARRDAERDLAALFDAEYPRLRGLAFVLLGDAHAAEEAAMDAFVKTFSSWTRRRRLDSPAAYLTRVVVNECRGKIRRRAVELRANALAERRPRTSPAPDTAGADDRLDVWAAVRALPPRQRACVVLRYLEDLSDAEIAETLDCSIGTVKTHMSRARKSLERTLGPDA